MKENQIAGYSTVLEGLKFEDGRILPDIYLNNFWKRLAPEEYASYYLKENLKDNTKEEISRLLYEHFKLNQYYELLSNHLTGKYSKDEINERIQYLKTLHHRMLDDMAEKYLDGTLTGGDTKSFGDQYSGHPEFQTLFITNWHGEKKYIKKTKYDAWQEFITENPELYNEIIKEVGEYHKFHYDPGFVYGSEESVVHRQKAGLLAEKMSSKLIKAYVILRTKGFSEGLCA